MEVSEDPDEVVREFRTRFYDTQKFFDKYAGGKFAHYLFRRHSEPPTTVTPGAGRQAVEQAQLFLEAVHACRVRLVLPPSATVGGSPAIRT
jgi:sulfite reductase (ferredoxin)